MHGPFETRQTIAFSLSTPSVSLSSTLSSLCTLSDHYEPKPAPALPTLRVRAIQPVNTLRHNCWSPRSHPGPDPPDPLRKPTAHPQKSHRGSCSTLSVYEWPISHSNSFVFPQPSQLRLDAIPYHGHTFTDSVGANTVHPTLIPATSLNAYTPNPIILKPDSPQ